MNVVLNRGAIEVTVRDEGEGFNPDDVEDDDDHHRGLTLIRNLVDEIQFNDVGNEIKLIKRCESTTSEPPTLPLD